MTDEQDLRADEQTSEAARRQPPRPFDDEGVDAPEAPEATGEEQPDAEAEPEPDVVATGVEPDAPEAFEDLDQLPGLLEALLFVADHPIDVPYLSRAVEVSQARVERALDDLAESLREAGRGIRVQRGPEGVQLTTAPEAAAFVERFLGLEATRRLSTAALETLAIIAYRQPITRGQIDTIRGVSSDGAVATLRARDLIESAGHAPGPGRPMLFRTTGRFLEHFGLERPGQLPPLPEDIDLPPAEIQATLGLDEATVEAALRPVEPEPAAVDDAPTAEDAARDEIVQAVAAAEAIGGDIPSDVEALSAAAEQAFIASRDRVELGVPDSGEDGGDDAGDAQA
jgi:segregation and condensation protein B